MSLNESVESLRGTVSALKAELDLRERMLCAVVGCLEREMMTKSEVLQFLRAAAREAEGLDERALDMWWSRHKIGDLERELEAARAAYEKAQRALAASMENGDD